MGSETSSTARPESDGHSPAGQARPADHLGEGTNLRLLLELRRRLKSAAERELAIGQERVRWLRAELRRAQAELRLWARMLQSRGKELAAGGARITAAAGRAAQTCERLSSLERENGDLTRQLERAERAASDLQLSVPPDTRASSSTLDTFIMATRALVKELGQAARDQAALRARAHDLLEESQTLAAHAESLSACFQAVQRSIAEICTEIGHEVDGAPPADEPGPQEPGPDEQAGEEERTEVEVAHGPPEG